VKWISAKTISAVYELLYVVSNEVLFMNFPKPDIYYYSCYPFAAIVVPWFELPALIVLITKALTVLEAL
jgi:hypothetical protein